MIPMSAPTKRRAAIPGGSANLGIGGYRHFQPADRFDQPRME